MKIGFLRSGQSFDIDFYNGSANALGTDLRVPIMEACVELGHEIYILGMIPKKQQWLLEKPELHPHHDYRWFSSVIYTPKTIPQLDLLIIECSTTNAFYGESNLKRLIEVLGKTYNTTCVVYQHGDASREIAVPLGDFYFPAEKKSLIAQWSREAKLEENGNRFVLWTHALHPELVQQSDSNRTAYNHFVEKALFVPMSYSPNFDRPLTAKPRSVDIIYIGREKTTKRTDNLIRLAGREDCCTRQLYGKWDHPPEGWDYKGFVAGHGRVYEILPQARASICVADPWFYKTGTLTTRVTQTIRSGALLLMDSSWSEAGLKVAEKLVANHADVENQLERWKELAERQSKLLRPWSEVLPSVLEQTLS